MSDKTTLTVRRVMGMVLLVLCAVCAAALVIACVQISLGGEHPFTPESVQAAWAKVAIFVFLFVLAAVAAGLWHVLFFVPSGKQKGLIFPELRLAKAKARLFRKQYAKELLLPLTKQEIYVRSMKILSAAQFLRSRIPFTPEIGLVLGSGLGDFADTLENPQKIPYADIPDFP